MNRFFALTALLLLAAAPQHWTQYQSGAMHNAVLPGTLRANWLRPLGGKINGGLAYADGTIYADSFDRQLYAIDAASGEIRWSAAADNILMSTPVIEDGLVIVGSGKDGFLKPDDASSQVWGRPQGDDVLAFSTRDGHAVWKVHTIGEDMTSPAVDRGAVFFANGDAHAYARDLRTGAARWSVELPGVPTMASATVHDGRFFVSICHNAPYYCQTRALDERDGRTLWVNANGGSDCTPSAAYGLVFVVGSSIDAPQFHTGGRETVAAIDERTGRTRWSKTFAPAPFTYIASSERQIAGTVVNGVLYQSIANLDRVVAFDARSGREIWSASTTGNVKMSPVVRGNRVYFGDTQGIFYAVDRTTGRIERTVSYLQPFSVSPPLIVGDTLFVANGSIVVAMRLDRL
jgi:outer membrane protein assembly factor BamB